MDHKKLVYPQELSALEEPLQGRAGEQGLGPFAGCVVDAQDAMHLEQDLVPQVLAEAAHLVWDPWVAEVPLPAGLLACSSSISMSSAAQARSTYQNMPPAS